jgi:TldD protein
MRFALDVDYSKILKAALAEGGEYADLYIEDTRPTAIALEDRKVDRVVSGVESGAGLRVIIGLRTVYAYTNELTEAALLSLAGRVARACGGKGGDIVIDLRVKKPPVEYTVVEPPLRARTIPASRRSLCSTGTRGRT